MRPINLNKARKARAKAKARVKADENAIRFGRSMAAKQADKAESTAQTAALDAHRIDKKPEK